MAIDRPDFVRRGGLWLLGATILTPELLDRLTWRRTLWPGATFSRRIPPGYKLTFDRARWESFLRNGTYVYRESPARVEWHNGMST